MQTTLMLDDTLLKQVREFDKDQSVDMLVNEALRLYVQMRVQENIRELRGALAWSGDLPKLREQRHEDIR